MKLCKFILGCSCFPATAAKQTEGTKRHHTDSKMTEAFEQNGTKSRGNKQENRRTSFKTVNHLLLNDHWTSVAIPTGHLDYAKFTITCHANLRCY